VSLILNGGIGGSGTTQTAYIDSKIASNLPLAMALCWRAGENGSAAGPLMRVCQSAVTTLNTNYFGGHASRSVGPIISQAFGSRGTTSTFAQAYTLPAFTFNIVSITVGATTILSISTHNFLNGEMVRLSGTFTGITGIQDGRDYKVLSANPSLVEIVADTSG